MKKFTKLFFIFLASLFFSNSIKGTNYYLQAGGTITNRLHWWTFANGTGSNPASFTVVAGAPHTWNIRNNASISLTATWGIATNAIVNIGDGVSAISFSLSAGGSIGTNTAVSTNSINFNNLSSFVLDKPYTFSAAKTNCKTGSTFIYTANMLNGVNGVLSDTYYNLSVNSSMSLLGNVIVNGALYIDPTATLDLDLWGSYLTVNGTFTSTGLLSGGPASSLGLRGTGNIGTLLFAPGFESLASLNVKLGSAVSTASIGNLLTVTDTLSLLAGKLDISGQSLTVNELMTNTSGSLTSTAASSLTLVAPVVNNLASATSGAINFDQANANIGDISIDRPLDAISFGQNLTVTGSCALTSGTLDISGKAITLNGALTIGTASVTSSSTSSLTISGGAAITGSLPITPSISDLTLNSVGQTLTLLNPLNVFNSITPTAGTIATGGNVTLKNSAATKSRLGIVGATGAITGNLTVENYIPGSVAGWRTLGAPGISGLTVASWDGGSGSATDFAMTCSGCNNGPGMAGGGHFVSIQGDAAGTNVAYQELTSANALTPGVGVWVYDGNSLTTAIPVTQTKSGAAVTGNVPATSKFTSNPYACPLSVAAITPVFGVVQYFDPVLMAMTPILAGSIPAGQGFYSANVGTFTEAHKDVTALTTATSIYKLNSTNQTNTNNLGKIFKLKIDGFTGDGDYTYIRLHPNATSSYDSILDAKKMYLTPGYIGTGPTYSQYTSIASVNANQDYCVNSLPEVFTSNLVIPIVAKAQVTGQYTISPIDIQNLPGTACVSLKDKLLNINHDLRAGSYVCNIADTTAKPRFELTICYDPNVVTGINQYENSVNEVLIGQNGTSGAFIKTKFDKTTKSIVSAYNVMGQKVMADKEIEGSENLVYLDFNNVNSQLVIIKVTNDKGQTTKKVFIN